VYEIGLRKGEPEHDKYNAAQQIAYCSIVVFGFVSLLTGLAIYKPAQLSWLAACFGGYQSARFLHFWLTIAYVLFFIGHVAQVIRAGWNNFRGMVAGYEVVGSHEQAGR
jgi:thiosulfate reductase cytochrome b subunit